MARCGCSDTAPGSSECSCSFNLFGSGNARFFVSGMGSPSDPFVIDVLNFGWTNFPSTYVNGWSAYSGTTYDVPQYRRLMNGTIIQLRGRLLHAAAFVKGQTILTGLPSNIRPTRDKFLLATSGKTAAGDNGQVQITAAGDLICQSGPGVGQAFIQLDSRQYSI